MPYGISDKQTDCAGWAAVKLHGDGTLETIGCHENKQDAIDQMVAVSAAEDIEPLGERALPDNYRPASSDNVPEGRACANCVYYEHDDAHGEGDEEMAYCSRWNDFVYANHYCNTYIVHEAEHDEQSDRVVSLVLPAYIRAAATKGLEYNRQGLAGDGLTDQTVREARAMANGDISDDKVVRASAWAKRHAVDLESPHNSNANDDEFPAAGAVAHYLWGINPLDPQPARDWFDRKSMAIQNERDASQDNGKESDVVKVYANNHMDVETNAAHWISSTLDERRSVAYTTLELRASGDGNVFTGYAAMFDSPSEPLPYTEYVRAGAFAKTLNDGADVRLLVDHEGVPLARTKSGTLTLAEDDRGLRVEAELDPMNPDAQRVMSAMRRGDLSQMSFAFRTVKDSWNADHTVRELREVQLFDVSVVTYPAYEDTIAELRKAQPVTLISSGFALARKRQIQITRQR